MSRITPQLTVNSLQFTDFIHTSVATTVYSKLSTVNFDCRMESTC